MSIEQLIPEEDGSEQSLVVYHPESARPLQKLLDEPFIDTPAVVDEEQLPDGDGVVLLDGGEVRATEKMGNLVEWINHTNMDMYGGDEVRDIDRDAPEVLSESIDVPFRLTGYPEAHMQKMILTGVSRYIEARAISQGEGRLRASFQNLSRIEDKYGTDLVYDQAVETGLDVHVYGMPDWDPGWDWDGIIHGAFNEEFRRTWFVVYVPPEGGDGHIALVAREEQPRKWYGFWTEDQERVEDVEEYIAYNL